MVKIISSHRAGKDGKLAVGCSAAVFDETKEHILLIRRADNGKWAVPGGYMEAGENFMEACEREVFEETGLHVRANRLISIYTNPHILLEYADGNRWQLVVLHFAAELISGELAQSDESTELQFHALADTANLEMGMLDRFRIEDAFAHQESAIIRNEFGL